MTYLNLDRAEVSQLLQAASGRFAALLRALKPEDASLPVSGLTWNVGEVAAHMLTVIRRGTGDLRRSTSPEDTARLNALVLEETAERDLSRLADLIEADTDTMLNKVFVRIADDRRFPFHASTMTTIVPAMAVVLGELTIHGNDIATATGHAWKIDSHTAALIWMGSSDVINGWLKPEAANLNERYHLHFEGEPAPVALTIQNGLAQVSLELYESPDHVLQISADEFIFYLPYQRRTATNPVISHLMSLFKTL